MKDRKLFVGMGGALGIGAVVISTPGIIDGSDNLYQLTPTPDYDTHTALDYADPIEFPWNTYGITEDEYSEAEFSAYDLLPPVLQERANLPDNDPMAIQYNHSRLGFVDNQNRVRILIPVMSQ